MALKTFKGVTPSRRHLVLVERGDLYKGGPVKELTEGLTKTGGRNNQGRITSRRMGGGHKRRYRFIDFRRDKFDVVATVERLEYDPNRTAFIALVKYEDGERSYILAPQRLQVGDTVYFDAYTVDTENGETENIDSFAIKKDLSVKKGTGVNPSIDWMKIFSQVIAVVLPLIKSIISWVFDFISSKMW